MDETTRAAVRSGDKDARNAGYHALLEATAQPVWAYDEWHHDRPEPKATHKGEQQ